MIDMQAVSKIFRTDLVETRALRSFTLKVDTGELRPFPPPWRRALFSARHP
jgi:hypothetical protein